MTFTITVNGKLYDLSKDDAIGTIVNVGERFKLTKKEMRELYETGEVTSKQGNYIEVYGNA